MAVPSCGEGPSEPVDSMEEEKVESPFSSRELFPPVGEESSGERRRSGKSSKTSSRTHSPIVHTPRKIRGESGPQDEEAPLGYEPIGSDSERSTPSYLVWAKDLDYVLNDREGLELFREFLRTENAENALTFFYIIKSLKQSLEEFSELPPTNVEERERKAATLKELYRAIYQGWFQKGGDSCLTEYHFVTSEIRDNIRKEVRQHASTIHECKTLFDPAIKPVMEFLRVKHAAFAESDIYIDYVRKRQSGDCESQGLSDDQESSHSSSSSTCGDSQRPVASYLPTVEEGEESQEEPTLPTLPPLHPFPPPIPFHPTPSAGRKAPSGKTSGKKSSNPVPKSLQPSFSHRSSGYVSKSGAMPPNPYHTNYVPNLPPSTQDSEIHSMSSDADSFTMTESSGQGEFVPRPMTSKMARHREQRLQQQQMKKNIEQSNQVVIPRTMRAHERGEKGDGGGSREEQEAFAKKLIERLETLQRNLESDCKLKQSLVQMTENEPSPGHPGGGGPGTRKQSKKAAAFAAEAYRQIPEPQDASKILDDHMAHIGWDESAKNSPHRSPGAFLFPAPPLPAKGRSPGSKSPDRLGGRGGFSTAMTTSYPSPGIFLDHSPAPRQSSSSHRKHQQSSHLYRLLPDGSQNDRRGSLPARNAKLPPSGKPQSDTSGVSSGSSSGPSVASLLNPMASVELDGKSGRRSLSSVPRGNRGMERSRAKIPSGGLDNPNASLPRGSRSGRRSEGGMFWSGEGSSLFSPTRSGRGLSVGYFLPGEKVPYRTHFEGDVLTLKQFKSLLSRKYQDGAKYKYFFTCRSDEFEDDGVVHKEVTEDMEELPFLNGKIMAKLELK